MATVTGQLQTYNIGNYVGPLFHLTATETPLLSMAGGLTGGKQTTSPEFTWQIEEGQAASQDTKPEGADPDFEGEDREPVENITQIHQEGVELSYTKMSAVGQLADADFDDIDTSAAHILGSQPVVNEMTHQIQLKIEKVARDVEYSFFNGEYQRPNNANTARQTRGLTNAIHADNIEDAAGAAFSRDHLNDLLRKMWEDSQAPFRNPVLFVGGAYTKQRISEQYGYAPMHRNVGGLNIEQIETDFAVLGVVLARHLASSKLVVADMSVIAPVFMPVPGKGAFFTEPLAQTGAAIKTQLYGDIGLEYGPTKWHGMIENLATQP